MTFLTQIEDRWLMVGLTLAVLIAFVVTRDPKIGEVFTMLAGGAVMIFTRRTEKLLVSGSADTKAIVSEFLSKQ